MKRNPRPQNVEIVGHALRTVNKVCRTETTLARAASYYGRIVPSRLVPCVIKATGSLVNQLTQSRVFSVPSVEGSVMLLPKPGNRDLRLDLFRGLALLLIFLDHIPSNIVNWLTIL